MSKPISLESLIIHYINEQLDEKLPKVVSELLKQVAPPPDWLTEIQLADYWQLRTPDGKVTVHSIRKWTTRPEDEHPLPCGSMGEKRRYHREEADRWAREEAVLQRQKRRPEMKIVQKRAS